jgi:hypothetical protein
VPLYNTGKKSEIDGNRELHDAMDLMLSGLVNNVDSGEIIYWLVKNSGGMDQPSMNQLLQTLKSAHIASVDSEDDITAHSPVVQFEASKEALEQLRRQIFDNQMGLDVRNIAGGAATATQIKAAYEPLNTKADLVEFNITEFIHGILAVLGIDDEPTYTRSVIVNKAEEIQNIVASASYLSEDYVSRKLLEILGDTDKANYVLKQKDAEAMERFALADQQMKTEQPEATEEVTENG